MSASVKKIRKILVAVDFSTYSKNTLEYADEVSQMTGAELLVINIINQRDIDSIKKIMNSEHSDEFSLAKYLPAKIDRHRLKVKALVAEYGFKERSEIKIIVDHGIPFKKILKAVKEEDVDLLVIGPKGRSDLKGFLFGSVAEKLFRHSPVPVMSLR